MQKSLVHSLSEKAAQIAQRFSNKNREGNFNGEDFKVSECIPMSEHTATVIFEKSSGKKAAFFFYYIPRGASQGWRYFVPTDPHVVGMMSFNVYKTQVEKFNFEHNF